MGRRYLLDFLERLPEYPQSLLAFLQQLKDSTVDASLVSYVSRLHLAYGADSGEH